MGDLRRSLSSALLFALLVTASGCADPAVPAQPSRGPSDPATQARLLARLRGDDLRDLREAALEIAAGRDPATVRAASAKLVVQAQIVTSAAFRAWQRGRVPVGSPPLTAAEIEAEVDRHQDRTLAQLFAAMSAVGGPESVAYCLAFAENESAPVELRRAALAVLVRHVDRRDAAAVTRSAAVWERVRQAPARRP
jgi:hypothetical protein